MIANIPEGSFLPTPQSAFLVFAQRELNAAAKAMADDLHRLLWGDYPNPEIVSGMTADRMELLFLKVQQGTMTVQAAMSEISKALNTAWQSGADYGVEAVLEG